MRSILQRPVEFGAARLAPTTELAGLAELANLDDEGARLDAILRIAAMVRDEDTERARIADLHRDGLGVVLPRRSAQ